jgi:hypothetical protein
MIGTHGANPAPTAVASGPCGPARTEVEKRCREAERLAQAAATHQQRLRDARLQLADIFRQRELYAEVRDRRALDDAKDSARAAYREAFSAASDESQAQAAAASWLHEINRLNRQVVSAERNAGEVARRAAELEGAMPGIELAADAARIAAEAAEAACRDARHVLAACEEQAQSQAAPPPGGARTPRPTAAVAGASTASAATGSAAPGSAAPGSAATAVSSPPLPAPSGAPSRPPIFAPAVPAITLMLRGDRQMLLSLA